MAHYHGPRGSNVSQFIANLNTIPSPNDLSPPQQQHPQEFANFDDDIALFTNTDFFDFDLHGAVPDVSGFGNVPQRRHPTGSPVANDKMAFMNQAPIYYHAMPQFPNGGHLSAPNSLPPSPPNGVPYAGQIQQSQPTIPSAHQFTALLSHHQQQAGQKRKAESDVATINNPPELEEEFRFAAEEDKRRRNTAASARFRVKKKQREQALEKTAKEMTDRVQVLEARIGQLEMENKWLKGLITEKKSIKDDEKPAAAKSKATEEKEDDVAVTKKEPKEGDDKAEQEEDTEMPAVKTSLPDKKRGVGTAA